MGCGGNFHVHVVFSPLLQIYAETSPRLAPGEKDHYADGHVLCVAFSSQTLIELDT